MAQRNIQLQPVVEKELVKFMHLGGLRDESEAIQVAVREALERAAGASSERPDFRRWLGAALHAPASGRPRFRGDDALWR